MEESNIKNSFIKTTPWWVAIVLFIATPIFGVYIGVPIAIDYYDLTLPGEVAQLFILTPFVYFYFLIPLCLFVAIAFKYIRHNSSFTIKILFLIFSVFFVPAVFYGISISIYYAS